MLIKAKVKKKSDYYGVFARKALTKGETTIALEGNFKDFPSKYSIQIGAQTHLHPLNNTPHENNSIWTFLNHSCNPNSYISADDMTLKTLTEIAEGEEITFNYNTTEYDMAAPFKCNCKSENCYGEIKGFRYLSPSEQRSIAKSFRAFTLNVIT